MNSNSIYSLTDREQDIVALAANGLSAKEVAQELEIAPRTVERHLENCRLKFHARNRTHLVAICLASGILKGLKSHTPVGFPALDAA